MLNLNVKYFSYNATK